MKKIVNILLALSISFGSIFAMKRPNNNEPKKALEQRIENLANNNDQETLCKLAQIFVLIEGLSEAVLAQGLFKEKSEIKLFAKKYKCFDEAAKNIVENLDRLLGELSEDDKKLFLDFDRCFSCVDEGFNFYSLFTYIKAKEEFRSESIDIFEKLVKLSDVLSKIEDYTETKKIDCSQNEKIELLHKGLKRVRKFLGCKGGEESIKNTLCLLKDSIYTCPVSLYSIIRKFEKNCSRGERLFPKVFIKELNALFGEQKCFACKKESEKMLRCSQCSLTCYCDQTCQRTDWPEHKKVCLYLAALKNDGKDLFSEVDSCIKMMKSYIKKINEMNEVYGEIARNFSCIYEKSIAFKNAYFEMYKKVYNFLSHEKRAISCRYSGFKYLPRNVFLIHNILNQGNKQKVTVLNHIFSTFFSFCSDFEKCFNNVKNKRKLDSTWSIGLKKLCLEKANGLYIILKGEYYFDTFANAYNFSNQIDGFLDLWNLKPWSFKEEIFLNDLTSVVLKDAFEGHILSANVSRWFHYCVLEEEKEQINTWILPKIQLFPVIEFYFKMIKKAHNNVLKKQKEQEKKREKRKKKKARRQNKAKLKSEEDTIEEKENIKDVTQEIIVIKEVESDSEEAHELPVFKEPVDFVQENVQEKNKGRFAGLADQIKRLIFRFDGDGVYHPKTGCIRFERSFGPLMTDCVISDVKLDKKYDLEKDIPFSFGIVQLGRGDWDNNMQRYMKQNHFHNFSKCVDAEMQKGLGSVITSTDDLPECCKSPYARALDKDSRIAIVLEGGLGTNKYYDNLRFPHGYYMWVYSKDERTDKWVLIHRCFHAEQH